MSNALESVSVKTYIKGAVAWYGFQYPDTSTLQMQRIYDWNKNKTLKSFSAILDEITFQVTMQSF